MSCYNIPVIAHAYYNHIYLKTLMFDAAAMVRVKKGREGGGKGEGSAELRQLETRRHNYKPPTGSVRTLRHPDS